MALYGALAEAVRRNERVDRGTATFTGSTTVTLNVINPYVMIEQIIGSAPGVGPQNFTYTVSGRTLTIYAWQPTSNSNPTLVAATSACTVAWLAIGTYVQPVVTP